MKIIFISPVGKTTPLLFDTFVKTFSDAGHTIVTDVNNADIAFFDYYSGLGAYNVSELNRATERRIKIVAFDETDYGGMSKENWFMNDKNTTSNHSQIFLKLAAYNDTLIYFMRKMDKTKSYPSYVFPYEKIIECEFEPTTKEELSNREYDFFWIGNESPQRKATVEGLLRNGFKGYVHWTNERGKLPHKDWVNAHKKAKFFLESDGGGFGSERPHQLITVACLLKQENSQLLTHPFKQAVEYVGISENVTDLDASNLRLVLTDNNWLYSMYTKGIEHMKKYYTAEYRSKYLLDTIQKHLA